jgi:hypothetical protein
MGVSFSEIAKPRIAISTPTLIVNNHRFTKIPGDNH